MEHAHDQQGRARQPAEQARLPVARRQRAFALARKRCFILQAQHIQLALGIGQACVEIICGLGPVALLDLAINLQEARGERLHFAARPALLDRDMDQFAQHPRFVPLQTKAAETAIGGIELADRQRSIARVGRRQAEHFMAHAGDLRVLEPRSQLQYPLAGAHLRLDIAGEPRGARRTQQYLGAQLRVIETFGQYLRAQECLVGLCRQTQLRLRPRQVSQQSRLGRQREVAGKHVETALGVFGRQRVLAERVAQRRIGQVNVCRKLWRW